MPRRPPATSPEQHAAVVAWHAQLERGESVVLLARRSRMVRFLVVSVVCLSWGWYAGLHEGHVLAGTFSVVLFSLSTVLLVADLTSTLPVLVVSDEGLALPRQRPDVIAWSAVRGVAVVDRGQYRWPRKLRVDVGADVVDLAALAALRGARRRVAGGARGAGAGVPGPGFAIVVPQKPDGDLDALVTWLDAEAARRRG